MMPACPICAQLLDHLDKTIEAFRHLLHTAPPNESGGGYLLAAVVMLSEIRDDAEAAWHASVH